MRGPIIGRGRETAIEIAIGIGIAIGTARDMGVRTGIAGAVAETLRSGFTV
jgi:hypothetical protein